MSNELYKSSSKGVDIDKAVKYADEQEELINKIVKNANRGH